MACFPRGELSGSRCGNSQISRGAIRWPTSAYLQGYGYTIPGDVFPRRDWPGTRPPLIMQQHLDAVFRMIGRDGESLLYLGDGHAMGDELPGCV